MSLDVLHLSTERTFRGGERQLLLLHEGLADRGLVSHVLCRRGGELEARSKERTSAFRWTGLANPAGYLRARRSCVSLAPALLHCHDSKAFTLGSVVGHHLGIPVLFTRRVMFRIRPSVFNRWKYRRVARVVAISSAVAEKVAEITTPEKVRVVADGVAWDGPALTREESRRELGLAPDSVVAGTVGFFTREKNLPLMSDLAASLRESDPGVRILCIGPMESGAVVGSEIIAPGQVRDASRYYRALDLYVSPSTSEGLGTSLLDAVVRDIPAVAYDAGGTRDVFPAGSPWLVPNGDTEGLIAAVRSVVRDLPAARKRAREHGERARGIFGVSQMVDGNTAVYRDLLRDQLS